MTKPHNRFKGMDGKMQTPNSCGSVTFYDIDDEYAKLDALRVGANSAAACVHFTPQRHLAPVFNKVSIRLLPVCQMLVRWRAGLPMRRSPLERAIQETLQALDDITVQWGRPFGVAERKTLERVLADLQRARGTE